MSLNSDNDPAHYKDHENSQEIGLNKSIENVDFDAQNEHLSVINHFMKSKISDLI